VLEPQQAAFLGLPQEIAEGAESAGALAEPGMSAFEGLLDHRTPDPFVFVAFVADGIEGFDDLAQGVGEGGGFCGIGGRAGRGAGAGPDGRATGLVRFLPGKIVVVEELVAVVDEEIRGGILDADTDDHLGVLA